ncbi:MAG: hypothetical protein A3I00_00880 [Betaproteobacteria bacterium RIFCSPLOWO2_02_FULL_64_12]|nr:MAG: hypothetical protein A3I00_00880 [Betaproteobacteria bacterium RIFCSPLOWO2_02_FULL_64_12]
MSQPTKPAIDPSDLDEHRPYLVKYAMLQLRDKDVAEDLVQETFLAALTAAGRFSGGSSVRTWLTAILIHKMGDHRRRAGREISIDAIAENEGVDDIESLFQANGRYVEMPKSWGNPEAALTERRFFEALELCVQGLTTAAAQAFLLRELMGFEIDDICKEINVSATNCSVLLYRARMRLRACLETRWFAGDNKGQGRRGS